MAAPRKAQNTAKAPTKDVAWSITRITGTPAKQLGIVYAPDQATAIACAIEQFKIPESQREKLAARRT